MKVHKKIVKTAIKPLDYAILGVLKNQTNATSLLNIGSLETEEEWNKMSEEFILKACKSSRRRVNTIIEKMAIILSKFTVLYLSYYFIVYILKLKLISLYNRDIYYHTRIFLNLFLHSVHWSRLQINKQMISVRSPLVTFWDEFKLVFTSLVVDFIRWMAQVNRSPVLECSTNQPASIPLF